VSTTTVTTTNIITTANITTTTTTPGFCLITPEASTNQTKPPKGTHRDYCSGNSQLTV